MQEFSPNMRVAVFVDVQNLFYGSQQEYDKRLDYINFLEWCVKKRSLIRAIAYIVEDADKDQSRFKTMLKSIGFEIMSKPLIRRTDGSSKGNWDIAIAVDAVAVAPKVDAIVLATGDGDFMYLAEYLRNQGCRVEACGFTKSTSRNLIDSVDHFESIPQELCTYNVVRTM
jgi:uncharacterized LabA/DUF88 family protein